MKNDSQKQGSFVSHLTELRKRIIHSFYFLIFFFIISFYFSEEIYSFLVQPYADAVQNDIQERRLIFTALQETFNLLKSIFFCCFFYYKSFYINSDMEIYCPGSLRTRKISNHALFNYNTNFIPSRRYVGLLFSYASSN